MLVLNFAHDQQSESDANRKFRTFQISVIDVIISVQWDIIFPRFTSAHHVDHVHHITFVHRLLLWTHLDDAIAQFMRFDLLFGVVSIPEQRSTMPRPYAIALAEAILYHWIRNYGINSREFPWGECCIHVFGRQTNS